ncbi:MAG: hypothetical protein WCD79_04750 [Chthoniobacteraceae bacterium]
MEIKLTPLEIEILSSADTKGRIVIPPASAVELDEYVTNLLRLQKKGLVVREEEKAYYGAFLLTESGRDFCAKELPSQATGLARSSVST